jgi:hypothetical protein
LLKGARLGLKAAARGVSWAARGGLALGKKALEASVLRLWRAAVARLPASTTRPLLETFRKAAGAGGTGPVSLKTLRLVLGRAGEKPGQYALRLADTAEVAAREVGGSQIYGWVSRDGVGQIVRDLRGRPIINFTRRGLSSLEEAVKTFGHEAKHLRDFASGSLHSSEALAERAAEKLWAHVSAMIGRRR